MNFYLNFKKVLFILTAVVAVLLPAVCYSGSNMDVVLVMDSSGSMKKTDPKSLRIQAAKLFISLLDGNDRAGVMSFSDAGYPVSHLTPVSSDVNRKKLFKAAEKISTRGAYTNLYEALKKGMEMLSADKLPDRSKIIILMSDGMMDVGDPAKDSMLTAEVKNALSARLKDENIRVYTIAFTERSDKELLRHVAKRTGGFFNLALTDNEFHSIFTSIFESLKAPEMLPMVSNGFLVDGSVEEVTIVATKDSPDTRIQINAPDGSGYTSREERTGVKWFVSNKFDMITVKGPAAGRWEILFSTGENNKAYIITNLKLQTNFEQLYTSFGKPLDFSIWLEKDGVRITEQEVLDKIDLHIKLTNPEKETSEIKPFEGGEGLFVRRIAPFTAGNYKMKIVAKGKTFEREKTFVFYVAGVEETKEDIEAQRREEEPAVREPYVEKQKAAPVPAPEFGSDEERADEVDASDEVSWKRLITWFIVINLLLGMIVFIYKKRYMLINFLKLDSLDIKGLIGQERINALVNLIKRNKEGEPGEQEAGEVPVEAEEKKEEVKEEKAEHAPEQEQQAAEEAKQSEEGEKPEEKEEKKVESSIKIGKEDAEKQAKEKLAEMVQKTPGEDDKKADMLNAAPGEEVKTEDQPEPAGAEAEEQGKEELTEEPPAQQEPVETQKAEGETEKKKEITLKQEEVDKEVEEKLEETNNEPGEDLKAAEQEQGEEQDKTEEGHGEEQETAGKAEEVSPVEQADESGEEQLKTEPQEEPLVEEGPEKQEERTEPVKEEAVSDEPAAEVQAEEKSPETEEENVQAEAPAEEDMAKEFEEALKVQKEAESGEKTESVKAETEQEAEAGEPEPEEKLEEKQDVNSVAEEASKLFEDALKEQEETAGPEKEGSEHEQKVELHEEEGPEAEKEDVNKLFEEAVKEQKEAEQGAEAKAPAEEKGGLSEEELKKEDGGSAPD